MEIKPHILFFIVTLGMSNASDENEKSDSGITKFLGNFVKDGSLLKKRLEDLCGCEAKNSITMKLHRRPVICACLNNGYDPGEAPGGDNITTVYNTFSSVRVLDVDEGQDTMSIDIKLSFMWEDTRIHTTFLNGNTEIKLIGVDPDDQLIWMPSRSSDVDTLDKKALSSLNFLSDNPFTENTTLVRANLTLRAKMSCNFNLTRLPFDTQHCKFRATSKKSGDISEVLYDPGSVNHGHKEQTASAFSISITIVGNKIDTANYSNEFGLDIEMKRLLAPYLFQYYVPCFSVVAISSISFIIPFSAIPGRVSLVATLFLTLTNLFIQQSVSNKQIIYKKISIKDCIYHYVLVDKNKSILFFSRIVLLKAN